MEPSTGAADVFNVSKRIRSGNSEKMLLYTFFCYYYIHICTAEAVVQQLRVLASLLDLSTVPSTSTGCLITLLETLAPEKSSTSANTNPHREDTQTDTLTHTCKYNETNL